MTKIRTNSLLKGILSVFTVNSFGLLLGLFNSIILPKFLSIDTYAELKTFQLFYIFIGIFHLGTIDAISLKYGGKKRESISLNERRIELSGVKILLLTEEIVFVTIAYLLKNTLLLYVFSTIFFTNILCYYRIFYQAIGELQKYSRVVLGTSVLKCVANFMLVFRFKTDNANVFMLIYVLIDVFLCLVYEIAERNTLHIRPSVFKEITEGIMMGFPLLAGNIVVNLLSSIDRWFVKAGKNNTEFAYYSFAVSIEQILISLTKPFQISLYSYLCQNKNGSDKIVLVRKTVEIIGAGMISSYFIIRIFIDYYLYKYQQAIIILGVLFASQIWSISINTVFINLYKATKRQKQYLYRVFAVVILAFVFDEIGFLVYRKNITFAVATLVVNIVWYILSVLDFRETFSNAKDLLYLIIMTMVFLVLVISLNGPLSFVIYLLTFIILTHFMHGDVVKELWSYLLHK